MFKNLKIVGKNAITSKRQRTTSHFFDMLCKITISNCLQKIRGGQRWTRKLWPNVRYADTLNTSAHGILHRLVQIFLKLLLCKNPFIYWLGIENVIERSLELVLPVTNLVLFASQIRNCQNLVQFTPVQFRNILLV